MQYLAITPSNIFTSFLIFPLFFQNECRYPVSAVILFLNYSFIKCLNDGEPILLGQNSNEFRCECLTGFFGPFCEYQDTSQSIKEKSLAPTSTSLFSHSATNNLATITAGQQRGWETTFVNLLICVFFLLLLPSLNQRPTPPPHYWAAMGVADELRQQNNNQQQRSLTWLLPLTESGEHLPSNHHQQQRMRRRRRSVSPITEVTVQLPTSICRGRPIHSTRSVGGPIPLHQSQSLTLAEFHELLLRIQREMQTRQHLEEHHQQQYNTSTNWETEQQNSTTNQQNYHDDLPPIEPPPSYNELINQHQ
uniref:EGF-like domain-containing protein n=1 Tax=Meloidogyne hapla TaxID=6305 RepID=A0A1I8BRG7_MELHA